MSSKKTSVLVTGAAGAQGSATAKAFAREGYEVIGLVRDEAEEARVHALGARTVRGDLDDAASLERALSDVDVLALTLPLEYDVARATAQGTNAVSAAVKSGVRFSVFNTSARFPAEITAVPAFEIKRAVTRALAESGVPFAVIRPTFYLENLLGPWTLPGIVTQGTLAYPLPRTLGAHWIGHDDVALAMVRAVERDEVRGSVLDLAVAERTTGDELARAIGAAAGHEVTYLPIPASAFEQSLVPVVGEQAASGIAALYRYTEAHADTDLFAYDASAWKKLGLTPTPLASWLAGRPFGAAR